MLLSILLKNHIRKKPVVLVEDCCGRDISSQSERDGYQLKGRVEKYQP